MSGINVRIVGLDNDGGNHSAKIDKDHALVVTQKITNTIPFSQYLTTTGLSTGSSVMAITTGTLAAPVKFYIKAHNSRDTLITALKFFIAGAAAALNEFGTGTALVNGCRLYYTDSDLGDVDINPIIYTNYDLIRLANGEPAFGTGADSYRVLNAIGTDESFHPIVDFQKKMPFGKGIMLKAGSKQKLILEIRDNTLTSRASIFNCIAEGEQFL